MKYDAIIQEYLKFLAQGNYEALLQLFRPGAIVISPLYGEKKAKIFYQELFQDTQSSTLTLINIFQGQGENTAAAQFRYDWQMAKGQNTSFEVIDVFQFDDQGFIQELKIIYDTHQARPLWQNLQD